MTIAGFGATVSELVCPDRIDVTRDITHGSPQFHKTEWQGHTHDDTSTAALTLYKETVGGYTNYTLTFNWYVAP